MTSITITADDLDSITVEENGIARFYNNRDKLQEGQQFYSTYIHNLLLRELNTGYIVYTAVKSTKEHPMVIYLQCDHLATAQLMSKSKLVRSQTLTFKFVPCCSLCGPQDAASKTKSKLDKSSSAAVLQQPTRPVSVMVPTNLQPSLVPFSSSNQGMFLSQQHDSAVTYSTVGSIFEALKQNLCQKLVEMKGAYTTAGKTPSELLGDQLVVGTNIYASFASTIQEKQRYVQLPVYNVVVNAPELNAVPAADTASTTAASTVLPAAETVSCKAGSTTVPAAETLSENDDDVDDNIGESDHEDELMDLHGPEPKKGSGRGAKKMKNQAKLANNTLNTRNKRFKANKVGECSGTAVDAIKRAKNAGKTLTKP